MIDKRKNNGGHSTKPKNSSDKRTMTKAERLGLRDIMNKAVSEQDIIETLQAAAMEAKNGSDKHARFLFEYMFGKPQQTIDMKHEGLEQFILERTVTKEK
jgi:hypothetical protein